MLKPPLPFAGNKFRWHRVLKPLIEALPEHATVFDAFAGSFAVSRLIKDTRPDCVCIVNDCDMFYRARLECVENTNATLDAMRAAGARQGVHERYERYEPDVETALKEIARDAKDQMTVLKNLYVAPHTIRVKCTGVNYDVDACLNYCRDCVIVDETLDARKAHYYARACDLVVLDPPYERVSKGWIDGDYICKTDDAQAFCRGIIESGCAYWLFEHPESTLMRAAVDAGAHVIEYDGKRNRQHALEVLAVSPGCVFADCGARTARRQDDAEGGPVQLSLFG